MMLIQATKQNSGLLQDQPGNHMTGG